MFHSLRPITKPYFHLLSSQKIACSYFEPLGWGYRMEGAGKVAIAVLEATLTRQRLELIASFWLLLNVESVGQMIRYAAR